MTTKTITRLVESPARRLPNEVKRLRARVNRLSEELEEMRCRVAGQVSVLANRVARLESVTPAVQTYNGT
jgi:hypothetical protein